MSETANHGLNQPLPAAAVIGGLQGWFGYRRFPVFSLRWVAGRALLFGLVILALAAMTAFGTWAATADVSLGLQSAGYLFASFMLMGFSGPMLACLVRYRRWPEARERTAVVVAVLLGMGCAFVADSWASARLKPIIEAGMREGGAVDAAQLDKAKETEKSAVAKAVNGITLAGIYFLLGGGLALRGYFSEQRRVRESHAEAEIAALRLKSQQSELRLGVLQAQVEPHFLFNTLASIRSLLRQDPQRAEATLDALVEHLRATMPRLQEDGDRLESTLGQQLEICRSYLELMRLRLADRLTFGIEVQAADNDLPCLPLLLISLVENAVKHGIEPKRGPGRIDIRVRRDPDAKVLHILVEDDGVGLQPGMGSGIGLANIRAQLATRYGQAAGLGLAQREGGGVRATLRIPLQGPAA